MINALRPLFLSIVVLFAASACSEPVPAGVPNARADELAQRMLDAVDAAAWERTGAITWTYADRNNHLWDRRRHFVRTRTDDIEVLVNLRTKTGVASEAGQRLQGEDHDEAVEQAYEAWVNDSFWLTAMTKPFDSGTTRSTVATEDGREALLVQYSSGGVTPGDAYLWRFDENGRPTSWQMWASIVPFGGLEASWDGWVELPTGAWVSTRHEVGPFTLEVTDLDAAPTLSELVDGEPFADLVVR